MKVTITIRINEKIVNTCKGLYKKRFIFIILVLLSAGIAIPVFVTGATTTYESISVPYPFQQGDLIDAENINSNFSVLYNKILDMKNNYIVTISSKISQTDNELTNQSKDIDESLIGLETGLIPGGMIAMFNGKKTEIPIGWYLCDGQNGTPDLRDKFVVGAETDDASNPSLFYQGKNDSSQHTHDIRHIHRGYTDENFTQHKHSWLLRSGSEWRTNFIADLDPEASMTMFSENNLIDGSGTTMFRMLSTENLYTSPGGSHKHEIDIASTTGLRSKTPVALDDAMPPYHSLYFIMKK